MATAVSPEAEQSLVDLAQSNPTADLIEACNRTRIDALNKHGRLADEQHARRYLRHWKDQYGMTRIDGALEPVAGATVIAARVSSPTSPFAPPCGPRLMPAPPSSVSPTRSPSSPHTARQGPPARESRAGGRGRSCGSS